MVSHLALWGLLASLFLVTLVQSQAHAVPRATPQEPSVDPFYIAPAGYEDTAPGTVLRNRTVEASFIGLLPDLSVETYQLLYTTTAINGTPIAAVTTIFKPTSGAKTDRFVSFHTAYDGSSSICDPSYNYQLGAEQTDVISTVEMFLLQAYSAAGYVVSSPDYEGPEAAFGAGRLAGMAVLDSMRAVSSFGEILGFNTSTPKIVGTGYSGGSIATGWAASLHSAYAPELPVKGWAQGGTVANLTGTLVYLSNTTFAGFTPAAVVGLTQPSAYGADLIELLHTVVTASGNSTLDFAAHNCGVEDLLEFAGQSILVPSFQTLGADLLYSPTLVSVMDKNTMGLYANETPSIPMYLYHATQDEIIPYSNTTTLVSTWCEEGASVEFVTYASGGHATTEMVGFPDAFKWVEAAFEGNVGGACTSSTQLNSTLDPMALGVELEPILLALVNALLVLGNDDGNLKSDLSTFKKTVPLNGTAVNGTMS